MPLRSLIYRIPALLLILTSATAMRGSDVYYHFGPDSASEFSRCRTFDVNADGCTWRYNSAAPSLLYEGNGNEADDYLFLPAIEVKDTGCYIITMETMRGIAAERLQIGFATAPAPALTLMAATFESEIARNRYSVAGTKWRFTEPGSYYPVLRVSSPAGGVSLQVRNIDITPCTDQAYRLPLSLRPTIAESLDFSIMDNDGDGLSWVYDTDSACFVITGSMAPRADDWLLLPPVEVSSGNYELSFSAKGNGGMPECYEIRFGPDTLPAESWPVLLTNPVQDSIRQRHTAYTTVTADTATTYRAAIRYRSAGGDGMRVCDFHLDRSTYSLPSVSFTIEVDSIFSGTGEQWFFMPPFQPIPYSDMNVIFSLRSSGPSAPVVEVWEGTVADKRAMRHIGSRYGSVNSQERPLSLSYYNDAPDGQHVVAFRIVGQQDCDGGVIGYFGIDSIRTAKPAPMPPATVAADTVLSFPTLFGEVWIENMEQALAADVAATGEYRLMWGASPSLSDMTAAHAAVQADTTASTVRHLLAPRAFGMHYLAIIPLSPQVEIDSIVIHSIPYSVTTPAAASVTALTDPGRRPAATVKVVMPRRNMAGMPLWDNENMAVEITSDVDAVHASGLPGDTISLSVALPEGNSRLTVSAGNYAGYGAPAYCNVFAGKDAPRPVKKIRILPDADNMGALACWQPDSIGANGGYVDTDYLSYSLYLFCDGEWIEAAKADNDNKCRFRLPETITAAATMRPLKIVCANDLGSAEAMATTLLGTPLQAPYVENFLSPDSLSLPLAAVTEHSKDIDFTVSAEAAGDPAYTQNHALTLTPLANTAHGSVLLAPFAYKADTTAFLTLRMKGGDSAPSIRVRALSDNESFELDSLDLSATEGWTEVYISLPDTLRQQHAVTMMLTAYWTDKASGPLLLSRYSMTGKVAGSAALVWNSLPDTLRIGDINTARVILTNTGTDNLVAAPPLMSLRCDTDTVVIAPVKAPMQLNLLPGRGILLSYDIDVPAEYYGKMVSLSLSCGTDTLTASLPAYAGSMPVVVDLRGELLVQPARIVLEWGEPRRHVTGLSRISSLSPQYTVYRDSAAIAAGIYDRCFTDSALTEGIHSYHVAYSVGGIEYPMSNRVEIYVSEEDLSATMVHADNSLILPVAGGVTVVNPIGETVYVYRSDGSLYSKSAASPYNMTIPLPAGIYTVRCGSVSAKVIVR